MREIAEKRRSFNIVSPVNGVSSPISADSPATSGGGVTIEPHDGATVAPVTGTLVYTAPSNHAFSVLTDSGFTVNVAYGESGADVDGRGFTRVVQPKERVTVGEKVLAADVDYLRDRQRSALVSVNVSHSDSIERLELFEGEARAGETTIMTVTHVDGRTDEPKRKSRGAHRSVSYGERL